MTFGYDVGDVQRIGELFDPSKLRESAEKLLHYYPLHTGWVSQANGATNGTAEAAVNGTNGVNGINGANGANVAIQRCATGDEKLCRSQTG